MSVSETVLVDASKLRRSNLQKREINQWTVEILRRINDEIQIAHQECRQFLITELPIIFDVTNMSENDAKREIWSNIIKCLKLKNYRIIIQIREDSCLLKITWYSKEDEDTISIQKRIIESCMGSINH